MRVDLAPPLARYEETLDTLRRIVYRTRDTLVGMTRLEWEERVNDVDRRARKAYEARDSTTWRRAFNEVQALLETAWQEEFASMKLDDPAYVRQRVSRAASWASRVDDELDSVTLTTEGELRKLQEAELARVRAWFQDSVRAPLADIERAGGEGDADAARKRADAVSDELERIEAALERIPQRGMVTDRGGAGRGGRGGDA